VNISAVLQVRWLILWSDFINFTFEHFASAHEMS